MPPKNPRLQLRRGTAAEWTAVDPILLEGEVGLELDTGRTKVGDGSTAWSTLAYETDVFVSGTQVLAEFPDGTRMVVVDHP